MNPSEIISNEFLTDIGDDHVAIAADGRPYGRASTREALQRACPDAAAYVTAADLINDGLAPKRAKREPAPKADGVALTSIEHPAGTDVPVTDIDPASLTTGTLTTDDDTGVVTYSDNDLPTLSDGTPPPVADGSAFDHDGDGRVGGSAPRAERKRKPKS